jgi:hypothetical protein
VLAGADSVVVEVTATVVVVDGAEVVVGDGVVDVAGAAVVEDVGGVVAVVSEAAFAPHAAVISPTTTSRARDVFLMAIRRRKSSFWVTELGIFATGLGDLVPIRNCGNHRS